MTRDDDNRSDDMADTAAGTEVGHLANIYFTHRWAKALASAGAHL